VQAAVGFGFSVMFTDLDVVWFRDPVAYMLDKVCVWGGGSAEFISHCMQLSALKAPLCVAFAGSAVERKCRALRAQYVSSRTTCTVALVTRSAHASLLKPYRLVRMATCCIAPD
jgi:hypothetical protein